MSAGSGRAPPTRRRPPDKETAARENSAAGEDGSLGGGTRPDSTAAPTCTVVAIKSTGKRSILCTGLSIAEAERWATLHRPFAVAAGGDVVIKVERHVRLDDEHGVDEVRS